MKDSQHSSQKNKNNKNKIHAHFFDVVIILLILNIAAVVVVIFYVKKINSYKLPTVNNSYLKINSIPLPGDLNSINASAAAYVVYDTSTRSNI